MLATLPVRVAVPEGAGHESFRVRINEAGADGCLTMDGVVAWMQEAANHHAESLGVGFDWTRDNGIVWVQARIRVRMARFPAEGERIAVHTWPSGLDRRRAFRDFVFVDRDGAGGLIGAATSAWALIDRASRHPVAVTETARKGIPIMEPRVLDFDDAGVRPLETVAGTRPVLARPSDRDFQGHVNGARLTAWMLDAAHGFEGRYAYPAELRVDFRSECLIEHGFETRIGPAENGRRRIVLLRDDGVEAVRAEGAWGG